VRETRPGIPDFDEVAFARERSAVFDPCVVLLPPGREGAENPIPEASRDPVVDPRVAEVVCEVVAAEQEFAFAAGLAEVEAPMHPFVAAEASERSADEATRLKRARDERCRAEQEQRNWQDRDRRSEDVLRAAVVICVQRRDESLPAVCQQAVNRILEQPPEEESRQEQADDFGAHARIPR